MWGKFLHSFLFGRRLLILVLFEFPLSTLQRHLRFWLGLLVF